ncbi:MAG: phosphate acyltransferase PlsX [Porticoccaceae bacterium]|nr:phosphate acyltransferase PlsX [Porticoccaceae bacterium]
MPVRISVDAMGGDFGPSVVVAAVKASLAANSDVTALLYGDRDILASEIGDDLDAELKSRLEVRHSPSLVDADDKPSVVVRSKGDSSMALAIRAIADGEADACISAGNTGALMALSLFNLGTLSGISRPAICSEIPTDNGPCLLLDLGANLDCSAAQLSQFATLGSLTAQKLLGISMPSVGLLNVGSEASKGNGLIQATAELLEADPSINYQGFVEGDGIFQAVADVIVCDGFSGNVALKAGEGVAKLINRRISEFCLGNWWLRLVSLLMGNRLLQLKSSIQPSLFNGAYLLGLNGVVVKSHGAADILGFTAGLDTAIKAARHQLPSILSPILKKNNY